MWLIPSLQVSASLQGCPPGYLMENLTSPHPRPLTHFLCLSFTITYHCVTPRVFSVNEVTVFLTSKCLGEGRDWVPAQGGTPPHVVFKYDAVFVA